MSNDLRASLLSIVHVVLAFATGIVLCVCAGLLLFDRPSELFGTGDWIDAGLHRTILALLMAALAAGAVLYLNRAALFGRRMWIALVAAVPSLVGAVWVFFAVSLMLHPIGF